MSPFDAPLFIVGCVGGLLPDILRIIKNRYGGRFPSYLRQPNFWLGLILLVGLGGLAAWVLGATQVKEALIFGYAAPQLFSKLMAESNVLADRGTTDRGEFRLRTWWAS